MSSEPIFGKPEEKPTDASGKGVEAKGDDELSQDEKDKAEMDAAIRLTATRAAAEAGYNFRLLEKLKERVESKLTPIEIGDFLQCKVTQSIDIIPKKLSIKYRQLSAAHRSAMMKMMHTTFGGSPATAYSEYYQQSVMLACAVAGIQEAELPDPLVKRGEAEYDQKILAANIKLINGLPDQLYWLVWFNCLWFLGRLDSLLTAESLING